MLLLVPPSEGKSAGGAGTWVPASGSFAELGADRLTVVGSLAAAMADPTSAAKVLGVGGRALDQATEANRAVVGGAVLPAWQRYSGVVWAHLDPAARPGPAKRRAARSVVIVSGLLGLAAWSDPVPLYKLKMGARLPATGTLAPWWRPRLRPSLLGRAHGAVVVDLLPTEHRRAVDLADASPRHVLDVRFLDGERNAAGHAAKAVKGMLAAHLLDCDDPVRAAATFRAPGWAAQVERESRDRTTVAIVRTG